MPLLTLPRLTAGLATLAFAAGASAGAAHADGFVVNDPALDVPADKIEHVVREVRITGVQPLHTRNELYLGSDRAHWISRDAKTNAIVRETTFDRGKILTYEAATDTITPMSDKAGSPPWQTVAQEAAIWRHALETGATRQTGETTVDGRRAITVESVPGKWTTDEPSQVTTMVLDAETSTPYDIKTVLDKYNFTQDVAIRSFETLDRTPATEGLFDLNKHAGAKQAKTAKKHAAKKKTKKAATRKHRR